MQYIKPSYFNVDILVLLMKGPAIDLCLGNCLLNPLDLNSEKMQPNEFQVIIAIQGNCKTCIAKLL